MYDSVQSACDSAKQAIDKMMAEVINIRKEIVKLKTDVSGGGIKGILTYPWKDMKHHKSYSTPEQARTELTKLFEASKPVAEQNEAIATHNRKVYAAAVAYMTALGVPETYRKRTSSRSSKTTEVTAEWKSALQQAFPTNSGWSSIETTYREQICCIDEWAAELARVKRIEERSRKVNECKSAYIKLAAAMAARYDLEPTVMAEKVFEAILASNKYLCLAHWLQKNRGDWNDGCSYAEIGLRSFTIEDDQDQAVYDEISSLCSDWDGDGRCFRDCTWNYTRLFEIAKERSETSVTDYTALTSVQEHE